MKKIIIPIDLTKTSMNAVQYAHQLFSEEDQLTIVHVLDDFIYEQYEAKASFAERRISLVEGFIKQMICEQLKLVGLPSNIQIKILCGEVVISTLNWMASTTNFDLMVLGSKDKSTMVKRWFGSHTLGFIRRSRIPIYVIPPFAKYCDYKDVLIPGEFKPKDKAPLSFISEWNQLYKAYLHFIQVRRKKLSALNKTVDLLESTIKTNYDFCMIHVKQLHQQILDFIHGDKGDLMILFQEQQSFIHSLLFRSFTEELFLKSSLAILYIPDSFLNNGRQLKELFLKPNAPKARGDKNQLSA